MYSPLLMISSAISKMSFIYIKHNFAESGDSPLGVIQQNCENIKQCSSDYITSSISISLQKSFISSTKLPYATITC